MRILLCEDDENLGMLLREYLQAKGFNADLYADGDAGYKAFLKGKYDICVLDVMMPKKDGFQLAQEIRSVNSEVPIIFLTAKTIKEDILEGFKIGADDYITKPFNILELKARVRALLRRAGMAAQKEQRARLTVGHIVLDADERAAWKEGQSVDLTAKEFDLMELLMRNPGRVYSRENLLNVVWGYEYAGDYRTVDVHVRRLREKLEGVSDQWRLKTVWGVGYKFEVSGS